MRGSKAEGAISFKIPFKIPSLRARILDFSGVLGAAAPKGLGRSPYKICELGLSSLKASKNLEFLVINLEFLAINSRIPKPCVIPQLDWGISIWNSSLGILKFLGFLGVRGYFLS